MGKNMETQSEGSEGVVTSETPVVQESLQTTETVQTPNVSPAPPPPARKKGGILGAILVSLLILFLLAVAGGVGFLDYTLNNNLVSKKSQIAALQGKYEKLQDENKQFTSDLTQARTDLEAATGDLTKAQDSLKKAGDKAQVVETRISDTLQLLEVASSLYSEEGRSVLEDKVEATGDDKLSELWEKYKYSGKNEDLHSFLFYLFRVITENLSEKAY
jgi:uncharacterized protein HemX